MAARTHRLGILLSGRGSNFVAIAEAIEQGRLPQAEIAIVLSNHADAPGLQAARARGLTSVAIEAEGRTRTEHDAQVVAALRAAQVDLVCLAGYMRILTPGFVQAFPQRILNIHPSLLPAFPGLNGQQQAFDYGAKVAGCTVHFVDEELDHGVIVHQRTVAVTDADTPESLAEKILAEEHVAYAEAIGRVLSGAYRVTGRRFLLKPD